MLQQNPFTSILTAEQFDASGTLANEVGGLALPEAATQPEMT